MAQSAFISFHFARDHWRANQVRNIGALDGQPELPSNEWESVKKRGDAAVEAWIDEQMNYKSAVVVLVGNETASRKFVKYEITRAWTMKKPLLGIRIHGLKDSRKYTDAAGPNPFPNSDSRTARGPTRTSSRSSTPRTTRVPPFQRATTSTPRSRTTLLTGRPGATSVPDTTRSRPEEHWQPPGHTALLAQCGPITLRPGWWCGGYPDINGQNHCSGLPPCSAPGACMSFPSPPSPTCPAPSRPTWPVGGRQSSTASPRRPLRGGADALAARPSPRLLPRATRPAACQTPT